MRKQVIAKAGRFACIAAMLALSACGDHPPKDDGDDDGTPPVQAAQITVVAGDASASGARDATGATARFNTPRGITIDSNGNLYVADTGNFTIRKITPAGVVTTFAGSAGMQETINAVGNGARFFSPSAITIDSNNILYVADALNIRRVGTQGQVDTVAEIPVGTNVGSASLNHVYAGGIAVDSRGNYFVTNGYGTRRIAPTSTTMLEGSAVQNNLTGTRDFVPRGVAVDSNNNVFVADLQRTISRTNGSTSLTRLAGSANVSGSTDGAGTAASFERVVALTVDPQGNLYAADAVNNVIRKITPASVVTTVAGTLRSTTLRTGALPGSFADLRGITTDGKGSFYATSGNAIIKITALP